MTSHKHGQAAKTVQNGGLRSRVFRRIAGTSEAETSVSGKAECSLAIGEDKKTKLFGVTFTFQ